MNISQTNTNPFGQIACQTRTTRQRNILKPMAISILAGIMLITARIWHTKTILFVFLAWNFFLACIPFIISTVLKNNSRLHKPSAISITLLFLWLLFFPNAPYIVTDFFHLKYRPGIPLWYDLAILAIFAWNGLIIGFVSLRDLQKIIAKKYGLQAGWVFAVTSLILSSFGVYLGRYGRYNSWDLFSAPTQLLGDLMQIVSNPLGNQTAIGMTLGLGMFLLTSYYTFVAIHCKD